MLFSKINTDKKLAQKTIKGLTAYAELILEQNQESVSPRIVQARRTIEELEAYWGLDEKEDWLRAFDSRLNQALNESVSVRLSGKEKTTTINGLYRYAVEMVNAQGEDALGRIQEISSMIRQIGEAWSVDENWIRSVCDTIEEASEILHAESEMVMKM